MKKLSSVKSQQLVLVGLVTFGVIAGLWFGLISSQREKLKTLAERNHVAHARMKQVQETMGRADQIEAQLCENRKRLDKLEENMATGDLYSWAITTLRKFKQPYKVDIPQFSQIDGPKDTTLFAGFPYKQASITISGTASFHEFGRFVADFENQFPYARLLNLTLEPVSALVSSEPERLSFRMEIAALVKPVS